MRISCPAKLNLSLELVGRRPDGYHEIRSLMQTVAFSDTLVLRPSRRPGLQFRLRAPGMAVPDGRRNLALMAHDLFRERCRSPLPGLRATLVKRIPPGSGLGGGSSDAAAMLMTLAGLAGGVGPGDLESLAAELGSDVPFFLHGGTALATGRGTRIDPLEDLPKQLVLLVLPESPLDTGRVYRACGSVLTRTANRISILPRSDGGGKVCPSRLNWKNDLESVVFRLSPGLEPLKALLLDTGAAHAAVTGSGSALFGLYDSERLAATAAGRFESRNCRAVLTRFLGRQEARDGTAGLHPE